MTPRPSGCRVLLLTPPLTQLNTPYPATPYLTGFLRSRGVDATQADPGLDWVLALLQPDSLHQIAEHCHAQHASAAARHLARHVDSIARQAPIAIALLQGVDSSMAARIAGRRYLVEGPRFASVGPAGHEDEYLAWAFGTMGQLDRARYFATLFLEDVADAIRDAVDPHFHFARYAESLAASAASIDGLWEALHAPPSITTRLLDDIAQELCSRHAPDVVGMTIPFPGNVLGGLRLARAIKARYPHVRVVWGGGYINTELRELREPRLFAYVDAVTYDDGEAPLMALLDHYAGNRPQSGLLRTRLVRDGRVEYVNDSQERDVPFRDTGTPTYDGLSLHRYLAMFDVLNPMHRMWSDTRWNKLTVAHGCYWKKCSFCDISLDYINRFAPLSAPLLVDRMEALVCETGQRGFHFVDEAAPPAHLKAMADEILRRGLQVTWWANIRFDKQFTPVLCRRLQQSGCVAMSGGLEVASDRLLQRMRKGVSVAQVARVTHALNEAGILVHAYLMYGFPSQTAQEIVDSLEMVRQLFDAGCIDSAFWHRFSATAHSPIGLRPEEFGVRLLPAPPTTFARNDLAFTDLEGCDPQPFGAGLKKAVYNYMHGMGLNDDVRVWFDTRVPRPRVRRDVIARALAAEQVQASAGCTSPRAIQL